MQKNHKKKNNMFLILFIMILGLGLGYALLSQDLTINGITKVKGNNWSIHFDNVQISSGSVTLSTGDSAAEIDSNDDTLVEYTVTLNQPGDFYEFTVDVVNDGTVDGMIGEVISKLNGTVISTTNPLPTYLDYTVTYNDGLAITSNQLLEAGHTEIYKVRVEFKKDIDNIELPTSEQMNTFSFGVKYVQRDNTAIQVAHATSVYTINIIDSNDFDNTEVHIGQPIPNTITQYNSAAEVIDALNTLAGGTVIFPIYLKHTVFNNIVTDSYVEFVITDLMLAPQSSLTVGTYALHGEELKCRIDEISNQYVCDESQYYAQNILTLQTAYGIENCRSNSGANFSNYSCNSASANSSGFVTVGGNFICNVFDDGNSGCSGVPDIMGSGGGIDQ